MPDRDWLINLASSTFDGAGLAACDLSKAQNDLNRKVEGSIPRLVQITSEALEVHNLHAPSNRAIRLLSLKATSVLPGGGYLMLLVQHQIRVEHDLQGISAKLACVEGYQARHLQTRLFTPHGDALGGLHWLLDGKTIVSDDMIVRILLEDLVRAAMGSAKKEKGENS
jgi:hypothetical protein